MSKRRKIGPHETEKETGSSDKKRWAAVILAAGYGTRLAVDFAAEAAGGYVREFERCSACATVLV